ncbi:MAG: hypothetical protein AAGN82_10460 [Myxococcota bacterium]
MKPGDHPEFFRLPAPPGRSRESTIVLDATGRFFHDGAIVAHRGLHRAFAAWVRRHPEDGRYILSNDYDWCYLTVEATPLFVEGLRPPAAEGEVVLRLFDGREEPLDPITLSVDGEGHLRCVVRRDMPARFQRTAQLAMAPLLDETGTAILLGGRRYPLGDT